MKSWLTCQGDNNNIPRAQEASGSWKCDTASGTASGTTLPSISGALEHGAQGSPRRNKGALRPTTPLQVSWPQVSRPGSRGTGGEPRALGLPFKMCLLPRHPSEEPATGGAAVTMPLARGPPHCPLSPTQDLTTAWTGTTCQPSPTVLLTEPTSHVGPAAPRPSHRGGTCRGHSPLQVGAGLCQLLVHTHTM